MKQREKFSSRLGFILISAGCAIGLGNVYRFPIMAGAYGGALFVLIYIVFLVLLGLPVMTAELSVGRASQRCIGTSFDVLEKKGQKWHLMKYLGIGGSYLLMMFYTVISGWFCQYFIKYLTGSMYQVTDTETVFVNMISNPVATVIATFIVVAMGWGVCALGLKNGVERITKIMMVALFALMIGIAIYSFTLDGVGEGLSFYLIPNIDNIKNAGVFNVISGAMGQAFFTLSIGLGTIAIFGSYIGKDRRLLGESVTIVSLDTFVAIMAGLIIFPAYFSFNSTAPTADDAGAGFLFITLSNIFNNMGIAGQIVGTLFFLFMIFAALSTVIAVFENIMSFWLETTGLKRWQISLINFCLLAVLCMPAIFSENLFSAFKIAGKTIIDCEDFIVSNLLLPIGSLFYVGFCSWKFGWGYDNFSKEVNLGEKGFSFPKWMKRYMQFALPIIILCVLVISII